LTQDIFEEEDDYVWMKEIHIRLNERRDEQPPFMSKAFRNAIIMTAKEYYNIFIKKAGR